MLAHWGSWGVGRGYGPDALVLPGPEGAAPDLQSGVQASNQGAQRVALDRGAFGTPAVTTRHHYCFEFCSQSMDGDTGATKRDVDFDRIFNL